MTHGHLILTALREEMRRLGRKPSDVESAAIIDQYLTQHEIKLRRPRKTAEPTARKRDAVFDALCELEGQDIKLLTRAGAGRIAAAKKQIVEVMPGADVDTVVAEIQLRWSRWCQKHTDKRVQTVMALVSHWAELGGGKRTQAEVHNPYTEPSFNWRGRIVQRYPGTPFVEEIEDKEWSDVPLDIRRSLLAEAV